MRRAARIDANQPAVVAEFRARGATVQPLHPVGDGCPDLLVGYQGVNLLVEVKDGSKPPSARKLTDDQQTWHREWRGQRCIIDTVEQVKPLLEDIRRDNRGKQS